MPTKNRPISDRTTRPSRGWPTIARAGLRVLRRSSRRAPLPAPRTSTTGPGRRSPRKPRRRPRRRAPSRHWRARRAATSCPAGRRAAIVRCRPGSRRRRRRRRSGGSSRSSPDVDEVLHPTRRGGRCRLDHLGRHAEGHRGLALEDPVEDPDEPEGDPKQSPGRRLGTGEELRGGGYRGHAKGRATEKCRSQDVPGHAHEGEDQEDQQALVDEGGLERRDDRRIVGAEPGAHSPHDALVPSLGGAGAVRLDGRPRLTVCRRHLGERRPARHFHTQVVERTAL